MVHGLVCRTFLNLAKCKTWQNVKPGKTWKPGNQGKRETATTQQSVTFWHWQAQVSSHSRQAEDWLLSKTFIAHQCLTQSQEWRDGQQRRRCIARQETVLFVVPGPGPLSAVLSLPSAGQYQHLYVCLSASNLLNYLDHERTKQRFSSKTRTDSGGWSKTPRKKRKVVCRSFHYYKRRKRKGLFLFKVWERQ